jgi:carboxyl-terminal processing protease
MPKTVKVVITALLIASLVALSVWAGYGISRLLRPTREAQLMGEVYALLSSYYVNPEAITPKLLEKGSVDEMLDALNDQYTYHISAQNWIQMQSYFEGDFFIGIGVKLGEDGGIVVLGVVPDSPADEADIEPGDLILAIDGNSTTGMTPEQAVLAMRGEEGTNVTLLVQHQDGEQVSLTLTRERIDVSTWWQGMVADDIAYIDIDYFSGETGDEFLSALQHIQDDDVAGIILDLRDNPGGVIDAAANVTDQFLEGNVTIVSIVYGDGSEQNFTAESGGLAEDPDLKIAVLVNGSTASAAEIVAGALQDSDGPGYSRVCLIGTETYGKGCMQYIITLSDGSAVSITCAYWYTPSRYPSIHLTPGNGLTPDLEVEGEAAQLQQAIDYIAGL